ncbi:endonuclease NucS [Iodobacter sp. CM08]|uniref:endonuclease NucS domain-containing protein n=1 Tax=Iodobacter sp. CM08 TaxID=3085902 RepID=UPI0029824726|nr:endonuclease NucS domain-containing protein [Iodobacter sp. CM08]MDW5416947.1 endonuclease NucS [Iodobacter sp. CM08]
MSNYSSIKDLVIDTCASEGQFPSYEKLTNLVLNSFPNSKWQKTHYAWYKSKIKRGGIAVPGGESDDDLVQDATAYEVEETIEASLSLERDLHSYLARAVHEVENGLVLQSDGIEHQIDAGRIDLLAKDPMGQFVVIELKAGIAKDAALGQLLGYIGCVTESHPENSVRGILIASDFDKRVVYAAKALPQVKLIKYKVAFQLQDVIL